MDITQHKHKKVGKTLEQQNKAFFHFGKYRSGNKCVAMVTSQPLSQCVVLAAHQPCKISTP